MLMPDIDDLQQLTRFLRITTPDAWLEYALQHIPTLLADHAHCERKAASTAINFMSKYPEKQDIIAVMSPLAREELLHFEKVSALLNARKIMHGPLPPSLYAKRLHQHIVQKDGAMRLVDQLIVGAIIEARSCERFHALAPHFIDKELRRFYSSLVRSEARHFKEYIRLARLYGDHVDQRMAMFLDLENELILSKDTVFRLHSGVPCLIMHLEESDQIKGLYNETTRELAEN